MGNTYGRIAAVNRTDATETELYDVPAATEVIGEVIVCNRAGAAGTYRIAVTDGAGAAADEDWIEYDTAIEANVTHRVRVTLSAANYVRVAGCAGGAISFTLMGMSIT